MFQFHKNNCNLHSDISFSIFFGFSFGRTIQIGKKGGELKENIFEANWRRAKGRRRTDCRGGKVAELANLKVEVEGCKRALKFNTPVESFESVVSELLMQFSACFQIVFLCVESLVQYMCRLRRIFRAHLRKASEYTYVIFCLKGST